MLKVNLANNMHCVNHPYLSLGFHVKQIVKLIEDMIEPLFPFERLISIENQFLLFSSPRYYDYDSDYSFLFITCR